MPFGTWRFLLPGRDAGLQHLWRACLSPAFPHLQPAFATYSPWRDSAGTPIVLAEDLAYAVTGLHLLRNRIAHLEPIHEVASLQQQFKHMCASYTRSILTYATGSLASNG